MVIFCLSDLSNMARSSFQSFPSVFVTDCWLRSSSIISVNLLINVLSTDKRKGSPGDTV